MKYRLVLGLAAALLMSVDGLGQTVDSVITDRIKEPYGIAAEVNVLYITDSANHRVVRYVPDTGAFSTLAGFAGQSGLVNDTGVYARFNNPHGIVSVPARGGLVVADYANQVLRLIKFTGEVSTLAGTPGTAGPAELGVVSALSAHFNFPSGLSVDSNGVIYIADSKNNAIRKLDLNDTVTTVATGFNEPAGVAVGDNGELWVSDSRSQVIKRVPLGSSPLLVAGVPGQSGALDAAFADQALFKNPAGLLWLGSKYGLLVCDSGNHAIRQIWLDPEMNPPGHVVYSVKTLSGVLGQPGLVNGSLQQALFNTPISIIKDPTGGYLVADLANDAIRRVQTSPPLPRVHDPTIGYVVLQKDNFGDTVTHLVPMTQSVFNNEVVIAIVAEAGTETYFTHGDTPPSSLEDTIPSPSRLTGSPPQPYTDGQSSLPPSILPPSPDLTIKAISTQDGRQPSSVVQARFQFKTANPTILGDNAASFELGNITVGAEMWYTLDGSEPTVNGPGCTKADAGQVSLGRITQPIRFRVRAFHTGFKPSEIIEKTFQPDDFQANRISFGFEQGEASSDFVGSPGQTFFAPVTLSLLPSPKMYTLQFNLTVTNLIGPAVVEGAVDFQSMLQWQIDKGVFLTIPPALFRAGQGGPPPVPGWPGFGDLDLVNSTNLSTNLLAVGWFERAGKTNLYDTTKQDLITYSIAHDTLFESKNQKVVVGGYNFVIPIDAAPGNAYQIQIGRPSATSDGIGQDVYIEPAKPTSTDRKSSIQVVTVGQRQYVVGDVAPFRWFNAGDFGEGLLLNNDVAQVFQSAIYHLNSPPPGSDFFDAMDSSDGSGNGLYSGNDTSINQIQLGDGALNVDDVYVTFRRSLDPNLTWFARYWEGGLRKAVAVPNVFRNSADSPGQRLSASAPDGPAGNLIAGQPAMALVADDVQVNPGQTLQIPIRTRITGVYPLRVMMLNLTVEPLDGAPALEQPVEFSASSSLGQPTFTTSRAGNNFAGAWLDSGVAGVRGDGTIGQLKLVVPPSAPANAAYRIHFDHASASPNGLALFSKQVQDGLITLRDRSSSSLGDGIPDTWRLKYFGSISNLLAQADADADGDGLSNRAEFQAGTDPVDPHSHLRVAVGRDPVAPHPLTLRWPSVLNKSYTIETARSLIGSDWTVLGSGLLGTGQEMLFTPSTSESSPRFFRVRVAQ